MLLKGSLQKEKGMLSCEACGRRRCVSGCEGAFCYRRVGKVLNNPSSKASSAETDRRYTLASMAKGTWASLLSLIKLEDSPNRRRMDRERGRGLRRREKRVLVKRAGFSLGFNEEGMNRFNDV